jgi:hypothetical protein
MLLLLVFLTADSVTPQIVQQQFAGYITAYKGHFSFMLKHFFHFDFITQLY